MNLLNTTNKAISGLPNLDAGLSNSVALIGSDPLLVREAGLPYQLQTSGDPIEQWLSLMEVVQMLCPAWTIRNKPMQGTQWRL